MSVIQDPDNGIKIGDLIKPYQKGYWIVTSIEKREGNSDSAIHYELAFDSNFEPVKEEEKKKDFCSSSLCKKVDQDFIKDMIKEKTDEIDKIASFAAKAKIVNYSTPLVCLSEFQISYATRRIALWLDTTDKRTRGADADHSALLNRVLSGKDPLRKPPPVFMSCPWYELGEGKKIELDQSYQKMATIQGAGKDKICLGNSSYFEWYDKEKKILIYPVSEELFQITEEDGKVFIQKVEKKTEEKSFKPFEIDGKWIGCDYCGSVDCDGKECH